MPYYNGPYNPKGIAADVLDPTSDEHLEKFGWKVGAVDFRVHRYSIGAYIIMAGNVSASLWRYAEEPDIWRVEYVTLPGYGHGSFGPPIDGGTLLPEFSPWREGLKRVAVGGEHRCITLAEHEQMVADAAEAWHEKLYASSYGLGL